MERKYKEKIKQLCKQYNFKDLNTPDNPNFEIWQTAIIEELYQAAQLYQLYKTCEGNPITITSTISIPNPQNGIIKGTEYKINIDIEWIKEYLFHFVNDIMFQTCIPFEDVLNDYNINTANLKLEDIGVIIHIASKLKKMYKCTNNAKMGWHIDTELRYLNRIDFFPMGCSETKKYSFIYDNIVLMGKAKHLGEGYSGSIGKEKYTQVRNWIKAFKTQIENANMEKLKLE